MVLAGRQLLGVCVPWAGAAGWHQRSREAHPQFEAEETRVRVKN